MTDIATAPNPDEILTDSRGAVKIAAAYFDKETCPPKRRIERWSDRGLIPCVRIAGHRFYRINELRKAFLGLIGSQPSA